jgi:hypothetical protein
MLRKISVRLACCCLLIGVDRVAVAADTAATAGKIDRRALAPGFPKDGTWVVRSEGLHPLP